MIGLIAASLATMVAQCASPSRPSFFLESLPLSSSDTVARVRLCLMPPAGGVGSYSATISFDSAQMRVLTVDVSGGLQAANKSVANIVRIAGASPSGFGAGPLATIIFKPRRGRSLSRVKLAIHEATSVSGVSVLREIGVRGYPATDRLLGVVESAAVGAPPESKQPASAPTIDSIVPRSGRVDAETVRDITVHGKGFASTGNVVLFGDATIENLASESGGTVIHFMAPTVLPARGSRPSQRVTPGSYAVRVRTPAGTSGTARFVVLEDHR
ncbi:MAG TPA: IPT/TIG domain-containing protein [Gemmatimonadaceae bacterium]|jgi:hypothetical protein